MQRPAEITIFLCRALLYHRSVPDVPLRVSALCLNGIDTRQQSLDAVRRQPLIYRVPTPSLGEVVFSGASPQGVIIVRILNPSVCV